MTTPDLNQLTIAGSVDKAPQLRDHDDCGTVCRFMLTHTVQLPGNERFSAEIQFYSVAIHGPLGESFAAVYKPDQKIIIHGHLDCEHHHTLTGLQPHRHDHRRPHHHAAPARRRRQLHRAHHRLEDDAGWQRAARRPFSPVRELPSEP
ncbi:MAG: hypothetical protein QOF67_1402 [Mycobacterium sp.]|nr:hypothetical protein [Mycobacterium sp.]